MKTHRSRSRRRSRSARLRQEEHRTFFAAGQPSREAAFFQPATPPAPSVQLAEVAPHLEGHNLIMPPLQGEPTLEAVFDGVGVVKHGDSGPAVARLQEALVGIGYALPQFGIDGEFGTETKVALQQYQTDADLLPDGKAGRDTLSALDQDLRHGHTQADTDAPAFDSEVTQKFGGAANEDLPMIFFLQNEFIPDAEELARIEQVVAEHGDAPSLTLRGFASDEGSDASNAQIAAQRMDAVAAALSNAGYDGIIFFDHDAWKIGQDNVNFARMRSVKIVPEGSEELDFDQATEEGERTRPCPEIDESLEALFQNLADEAIDMVDETIGHFPLDEATHLSVFDELFDTIGDEAARDQTMPEVLTRLQALRNHLARLKEPDMHRCGTTADPTCQSGAPAYNRDKNIEGVDNAEGILTLCSNFKNLEKARLPFGLIHEAHHGMPGFFSRDEAYAGTRPIAFLSTQRALQNAGTFELLVRLIVQPGTVAFGPAVADDLGNIDDPVEQELVSEAVAWPQQWIIRSRHRLSGAYFIMVKERAEPGQWYGDNSSTGLVQFLADRFGITPPPSRPTMQDLQTVAALFDRTIRLEAVFDQPFSFTKTDGAPTRWAAGPGQHIDISPFFMTLSLPQRMQVLLQELIRATPDISADFAGEYVAMYQFIRNQLGLGPD